MPTLDQKPLSANQQAMLDLALACDLKVSKTSELQAILDRHARIKTHANALVYIRSVEQKIHSRRKVVHLQGRPKSSTSAPPGVFGERTEVETMRALLKRRQGQLDDEFAMKYFKLVIGQYKTMENKVNDPAAEAEAQQIIAMDPAKVEWEDIYRLELAILKLEPVKGLCRKAWIMRQEYSEIASADERAKYAESKPPPADDPGKVDEELLRADLVRLQEEMNWAYIVMWIEEEFRSRLTAEIFWWAIGALFLFAAAAVKFGLDLHDTHFLFASVVFAGFMGGAISTVRKLQSINLSGNADLNLLELERGRGSIAVSPFLGAAFAVVLLYIFVAGMLKGSLFPDFNGTPNSLFACDLANCADRAKLLIWSFIAGFAEQFVPDRLDDIAKKGADAAKK